MIGKEMRLSRVEHALRLEGTSIPGFSVGKNRPERKDFVMKNLTVPVED